MNKLYFRVIQLKQQQNDENTDDNSRENDRQKILSEAMQLGDVNTRRIFSYQEKAPAAPESHQNPLRVVYSIKTPMSTKSGSRYIPTSPERILDAPDIINDYCRLFRMCMLLKSREKNLVFFFLFSFRFKFNGLERFKYRDRCIRTCNLFMECCNWKY